MSIVEQCARKARTARLKATDAASVLVVFSDDAPAEDADIASTEAAFAKFARLAQSPEMVERIVRQANYVPSPLATDVVTDVLAALFREAGVSGGGG
jgi:hypothetical protein